MLNGYTTEQAFDALLTIPPTIDHDTRARVGMAAKDAGITFDDYDAWQSANPRYDAGEVRSMWHSFTDGPVKAGTLFSIAKEHGWNPRGNPDVDFSALLKQPPKAATKPQEPPKAPRPGMAPAEIWGRCEPATVGHGYILAKRAAGVPLENLRVVPAGDSLYIAGQAMAGSLAVPAFAPDGTIQTIQFIPAPGAGKKLNLPGANVSGAWHTVGELVPGGVVHIVEGIG